MGDEDIRWLGLTVGRWELEEGFNGKFRSFAASGGSFLCLGLGWREAERKGRVNKRVLGSQ